MSAISKEKIELKKEQISAFLKTFESHKKEMNIVIKDLIDLFKDESRLGDCKANLISQRHRLVDLINSLKNTLSRLESEKESELKKVYIYYNGNRSDIDYILKNQSDKNLHYVADLSYYTRSIKIIKDFIEYNQDCIETLDKLGYSIKAKIDALSNHIYG